MRKIHSFKARKSRYRVKSSMVFLLFALLLQVTSSYAQTGLITNVSSPTGHSYVLGNVVTGTAVYSDRAYQFTTVPAFLNNAPSIKTPNDDKTNKLTSALSFTLTQNATVYVGYDPRATVVPAWLSSWQKLATQVGLNDPNISGLILYSKSYSAGNISLGGNLASPASGAQNMYIVAAVAQSQFNLTVNASGNGTVTKNPNQAGYASGSNVTLTATPAAGEQFTGWSGNASGTVNPLTITMDADKTITATFAPVSSSYTLTVTTNGSGTVAKDPDQASYPNGTSVSLTPTPSAGQQFTGWSGDASGNAVPLTVTMNANKSVIANFAAIPAQYTVTTGVSGSGTVAKSPNQASYSSGTSVTLTAIPSAGQQFSGWSGDASGTVNPLTITVTANKNITATFVPSSSALITNITTTSTRAYTLGSLVPGTTVYSDRAYQATDVPAFLLNAAFIKTPNDDKGSKVSSLLSFTLSQSAAVYVAYDPRATAIPAWLSTWQKLASKVAINDPNINGLTLYTKAFSAGKVTLGGNLASPAAGSQTNYFVMALAPAPQFSLTTATSGNGSISSNPSQASYAGGTAVTITATPGSGQQFAGWSGDATGNTNPLTINMEANKSITATFAPASTQYTLTVNTTGNGTVSKNPNQASYAAGTSVTLTAVPASGQQFTGWSGSASGTTNPLTVTMNSDKNITATFAAVQYSLSVTTNGTGTVTKNPNQATYPGGTSVDLTATPGTNQQFTGWSGDTTSTANPLTIIMNANKSVTATFASVVAGPTITASPFTIYDNDVSGGAAGLNRKVTVKNTGQGVLTLSAVNITGANANQFALSGLPAFPVNINTGDSIFFTAAFNPTSTGLKIGAINISSNDAVNPTKTIAFRGIGTSRLGGSNEPSLQSLFNLLEIQVNVGDDNVATGIINSNTTTQKAPLLGEEISIQKFQKAGTGDVTITPLDVFGPTFNSTILGFGWYKSGNAASKSELFTVSNSPVSNGQTVNVNFTGGLSFDPAAETFGFYTRWPYFNNRHLYSEDDLNTFQGAAPHHARVYLYKKNGVVVPNSYVVAFEEDTTKLDYQDLVFVVSNVKKFSVPTEVTILPLADAYVRNGTFANTNFGTDTALVIKGTSIASSGRYSYLKFSLSAIAGAPNVRTAKVRMYGSNKDNTSAVNATMFGLSDDSWTETGVNFNNGPLPSSTQLSTKMVTNAANYYEFDVTDFVKAELKGDKVISLYVKDTTNKNFTVAFNSKEAGNYAPQLLIDTAASVSNASLFVENTDGYPSNEHVVFSRIQVPWTRDTVYAANHDSIKVKLHNYGINPLIITDLSISVDTLWKIEKLNGVTFNPLTQFPVVVSSGGALDVMVKFIANNVGTSGNKRLKLLHETLTISSNDDKFPNKKVYLDGIWQNTGEGAHEPYSHEILEIFGYTSRTGFTASDPDLGDSTKLKGDEIKPDYFLRADTSKPVTVRQLNAHHGCCHQQEYFKWWTKGSPSALNTVFYHIFADGQTLLPRRSLGGTAAGGTFIPTGSFAILIGPGNSTVPALNTDKRLGVRVYKAYDASGNIIPDTYILANDYLGSVSNYDFNDNMYYITNVKPDMGTVHYSTLKTTPSDLDFGERILQTTDSMLLNISNEGKTYSNGSQDPAVVITSVVITGENAAEFSAEMPLSTTLNPQQATTIKVKFNPLSQGLKIADMLIYYNNAQSPKRVPLYGIGKATGVTVTANYRINSGATSATTFNGKTWAADNQYAFDNLEPFKNSAVKQISATDQDFLYVDEQSSNGDKKPFRYQIPVPNGTYYVRLHFAEIYWGAPGLGSTGGAGARVFSVKLENEYRLANYDLTQDVGGASAVIKNFVVTVNDGNLNIDFSAVLNRPLVSAVEVYSFSAPSQRGTAVASVQQPVAVSAISQAEIPVYTVGKPRVFPNPLFNNRINIQFPAKYQGVYTMQLTDIIGRKYDLGKITLNGTGATTKVDISRYVLKPGVYFLRINSNGDKADVIKLLIN